MAVAEQAAHLSHANRRKVGAVAVENGNIIGYGFNGMPAGMPNCCEDDDGVTLPEVIHAEVNLTRKVCEEISGTLRGREVEIFLTCEPCVNCANHLVKEWGSGLLKVHYRDAKRTNSGKGPEILQQNGIPTERLDIDNDSIN